MGRNISHASCVAWFPRTDSFTHATRRFAGHIHLAGAVIMATPGLFLDWIFIDDVAAHQNDSIDSKPISWYGTTIFLPGLDILVYCAQHSILKTDQEIVCLS